MPKVCLMYIILPVKTIESKFIHEKYLYLQYKNMCSAHTTQIEMKTQINVNLFGRQITKPTSRLNLCSDSAGESSRPLSCDGFNADCVDASRLKISEGCHFYVLWHCLSMPRIHGVLVVVKFITLQKYTYFCSLFN